VATIGGRPRRRPERFHQWGCRGHQFAHMPPWTKPYRETPGPQSPSTYLLGVFPFQFRRCKKEVGGGGGMWGKEGGGVERRVAVDTPGRSSRGSVHRGRSREPFRDADAKRKEQSRDAATAYHFAAPPVFPKPAMTTPPTQCECHRSRLSLSFSLVSTLC
jgi:hypothetical protein